MAADCQDEQHDVARNTVWRNRINDVGSSQFLCTRSITPHGSHPGYPHSLCPPCLCGDKGSNLGYPSRYALTHRQTATPGYST